MKQTISINFSFRLFLLISLILVTNMNVHAQNLSRRLSVSFHNVSLTDFTKYVEKKTGCTFIYSENVRLERPINLRLKNASLQEVLDRAFDDQPVGYRISGSYIFLQKKKLKPAERKADKPKVRQRSSYTVSGYVMDGISSETLIGANVISSGTHQGTASNSYGYYSITVPEGETNLNFSYLGYAAKYCRFRLHKDTLINVHLSSDNRLQEVIVTSKKDEVGLLATGMDAIDVPVDQIKHTPALLGETDVMRTIQLLPGIQSGTAGTAGLYVRGGNADENLILLDGIPVYKVDHLFGFFSVFTPEAMKKVTFFKGSFPARFNGRLSSVIDVRTKDGDMYHYHGNLAIGLLTSRFNFEGPIIKGKTSFNLSARRSYSDLAARPFMSRDEKFGYYFYDLNFKLNHRFSDFDRLYLSYYQGRDCMNEKDYDENIYGKHTYYDRYGMNMAWGNLITSLRWNHVFNDRLFCNTTVALNNYKIHLMSYDNDEVGTNAYENSTSHYNSDIRDINVLTDFDYYPSTVHHIKFGAGYIYHAFCPEVTNVQCKDKENGTLPIDTVYNSPNHNIYAHEVSVYAEDNWKINDRLQANWGFDLSAFHVQCKSYYSFQPRVSFRYQLTNSVALKAAYTKMTQYVHLLTSMPITMPTDLWVPVTKNVRPMQANQFSVGGYYTGLKNWEISAEAYYKSMNNVLEYKDGVSFLGFSSDWENLVEMGHGRAFGIEFMLQKKFGNDTGWLSYTLSKSDRKFSKGGINDGERFPYTYDRRHTINIAYNRKFSSRFDIDLTWMFYTGGTTSLALKKSAIIIPDYGWSSNDRDVGDGVTEVDYVPHRNNYRLPSSHTLCLGFNFHKKTKHGMRTWNISIYNAYDAMNPTLIYRKTSEWDGSLPSSENKLVKYTLLPFIPSFTYIYSF